jgi:hypothetical protein
MLLLRFGVACVASAEAKSATLPPEWNVFVIVFVGLV